jgi:hypothetical protein
MWFRSNYGESTAFASSRDTAGDYWTGVIDPAQTRLAQDGDRPPSTLNTQLLSLTTSFFSVCCVSVSVCVCACLIVRMADLSISQGDRRASTSTLENLSGENERQGFTQV